MPPPLLFLLSFGVSTWRFREQNIRAPEQAIRERTSWARVKQWSGNLGKHLLTTQKCYDPWYDRGTLNKTLKPQKSKFGIYYCSRTDLLSQGKTMVWKLRKTSFHHAKMLWPLVWPRNFKQNIQTAKSLNFKFPISNCVKYRTKKTEPISLISLPENRRNNTRKLIQLF